MPLNPGNFLFPIQNLGPDLGKFFEAYNTQQKRGEEREKALAENAMAKLKLERAPRQLDAELLGAENNAKLLGEQANWFAPSAIAQIGEHGAHAGLYGAQAEAAKRESEQTQFLYDYFKNYQNQRFGKQEAQMPQAGTGSGAFGQPTPMEGGVPWAMPGQMPQPQKAQQTQQSQGYQGSGLTPRQQLDRDIAQDPLLALAAKKLGYERNPEDIKRAELEAASNEKVIAETAEQAEAQQTVLDNLSQMQELMDSDSKTFAAATGPYNQYAGPLYGSDKVRRMGAAIDTLSANLQGDFARAFGGRLLKTEFDLAKMAKFEKGTPTEMIRAKVAALQELSKVALARGDRKARLMRADVPERDAQKMAIEAHPTTSIAERLKSLDKKDKQFKAFTKVKREKAINDFGGAASLEDL
jgi:hypothetical protein